MRLPAHLSLDVVRALRGAAPLAILNLSVTVGYGTLAAGALGAPALQLGVFAALLSAALGGVVVALNGRAVAQVSGPTATLAVIYGSLCADLVARAGPGATMLDVLPGLALTVVISGLLLLAAGSLRLADAVKFLPTPVSAGFVTGIGLLVIWAELPPLIGVAGSLRSHALPELATLVRPGALAVGLVAAAVFWWYPRWSERMHPALPALAAGTAVHHALAATVGPHVLGGSLLALAPVAVAQAAIPSLWHSGLPALATIWHVVPYAAFIALQAVMTSAIAGVSLANLTGAPADANRTVRAQGLANIVCGCVGGLPVTTVPSLSLTAAKSGVLSPWTIALSCVLVALVAAVAGALVAFLPLAAIAGVLVMIGAGLIDRWARDLAHRVLEGGAMDANVAGNLLVVAVVAAMFFIANVPEALFIGAVLAMLLLAVNLSRATTLDCENGATLASTRVWPTEQAAWLVTARRCIALFRPRGALFFGTADALGRGLAQLEEGTRFCIVDLGKLTTLDATGCQILAAGAKRLAARGILTVLAGVDPALPRDRALLALGLSDPPPAAWHADLDHALEWVESRLLAERWPQAQPDAPRVFAESPLARDILPHELETIRSLLQPREVGTGPLFRRGEPASSMFVVDRGLVEICIPAPPGGKATRLAAFGPGSIFGEISLLSTGQRTADAVCREPSRLYELHGEALRDLQQRAPDLHARLVANLGIHLANRLVIATNTVQAQQ